MPSNYQRTVRQAHHFPGLQVRRLSSLKLVALESTRRTRLGKVRAQNSFRTTQQRNLSNVNKRIPIQSYRSIAARFRRRSFAQGYRVFRRKLKGQKNLTLPRVRKKFVQMAQKRTIQYKKDLSVAVRSAKDRIFFRKCARLARSRINRRRYVRTPRNLLIDAGIPEQLFFPTRYDFDLRGGLYPRRSR